jgi:hypothetical protein
LAVVPLGDGRGAGRETGDEDEGEKAEDGEAGGTED